MKLEKEIKKTIIKTIEVPLGRIEKMEGGIMRALITAEIPDADGDVVVVKGMSWPRYNETNPLPVLSSHLRKLPDGKPPQVGFAKVIYAGTAVIKGESVPAVFMEWEWLDTELAREWRQVAEKAGRLSFSIGASVTEAETIEKNGKIEGFRYLVTELTEVSVVSLPANPVALSIKAERETDEQEEQMNMEQINILIERFDRIEAALTDSASAIDAIENRLDEIVTTKTAEANETDEPGESTPDQSDIELDKQLMEILSKVKNMKNREYIENGNTGDTKQPEQGE